VVAVLAHTVVVEAESPTAVEVVEVPTAVEVPARTAGTKILLLTQRPARTFRTGLLFFSVNSA
jgi:hypothetical protein